MADYGEYGGPIKKILGSQSISAANGSNVSTTITHEDQTGNIGDSTVTMIITTSGNCFIEIGSASTTGSFALTSSDTLVCKIRSQSVLGAWGNGGARTVTVKKVIC